MNHAPPSSAAHGAHSRRKRKGLCLPGGGIPGGLYSVGCLAAIEEAFEGLSVSDFDVIVATSTGSSVALPLAAGFPATRLYRALLDPSDDFFALQRHHLLKLDLAELRRMGLTGMGAFRRVLSNATANPLEVDLWGELDRFYDSLPAGLFTLDAYEKFLGEFIERRGVPKTLGGFDGKLRLVASDLDRGERVVLGGPDTAEYGTARAVVATSATPPLFAPVRVGDHDFIDGGLGDAAHADVALALGAELIVVIHAGVPIHTDPRERDVPTGHGTGKRVRDKGLLWVMSQASRIRTDRRFRAGFARFEAEHPEVEMHLFEPDRHEAKMFLYSPMSFAARRAILEDGYRTTLRALRREDSALRNALLAEGYGLKAADPNTLRPPAFV